jgi:cell division protein FtsL
VQKDSALVSGAALVLLWGAVMCSAFSVVYTAHKSRQAVQELEQMRREATGLKVMSGQFLLEQSSLSSYTRVEALAATELDMAEPLAGDTVLVRFE